MDISNTKLKFDDKSFHSYSKHSTKLAKIRDLKSSYLMTHNFNDDKAINKSLLKRIGLYTLFLIGFSIVNLTLYTNFNSLYNETMFDIGKFNYITTKEKNINDYLEMSIRIFYRNVSIDKNTSYYYLMYNVSDKNEYLESFKEYDDLRDFISTIIRIEILFLFFLITIFVIFSFSICKYRKYTRILYFVVSIVNGIDNNLQIQILRVFLLVLNLNFVSYYLIMNINLLIQLVWYVFIDANLYVNISSLTLSAILIYFTPLGIELNIPVKIALYFLINLPIYIFHYFLYRKEYILNIENSELKNKIDSNNNLLESLNFGILTVDKFNNINFNEFIIEKFNIKKLIYSEMQDVNFKLLFFSKLNYYNSKMDKEILKIFEDYGKFFAEIYENNNNIYNLNLGLNINGNINNMSNFNIYNVLNSKNEIMSEKYLKNNSNQFYSNQQNVSSNKLFAKFSFNPNPINKNSVISINSGKSKKSKANSIFNNSKKTFSGRNVPRQKINEKSSNRSINNLFVRSISSMDRDSLMENYNFNNFLNMKNLNNSLNLINSKRNNFYTQNSPFNSGKFQSNKNSYLQKTLLSNLNSNNYENLFYLNQNIDNFLNSLRKKLKYNKFTLLGRKLITQGNQSNKKDCYLDYFLRINPISNSIEFLIKDLKIEKPRIDNRNNLSELNKFKKSFIGNVKYEDINSVKTVNFGKRNTNNINNTFMNNSENKNFEKKESSGKISDSYILKNLIDKIIIQIKKHIDWKMLLIKDIKKNMNRSLLTVKEQIKGIEYSDQFVKYLMVDLEFLNDYIALQNNLGNSNEITDDNYECANFNSNINNIDFENFDIRSIVKNIVKILNSKIILENKSIEIQVDIEGNIPETIKFDKKKIEHILFILLSNSIKYTEFGIVTISIYSSKENLNLEVTDSGIGINNEEIPKIGYLFLKDDNYITSPIVGLGLFTVKWITESLNGKFVFDSIYGKGSVFKVSFPNPSYVNQDYEFKVTNPQVKKSKFDNKNLKDSNYFLSVENSSNVNTQIKDRKNMEKEYLHFSNISRRMIGNDRIKSFASDLLESNTMNLNEEKCYSCDGNQSLKSNHSSQYKKKNKILKGSRILEKNFYDKKSKFNNKYNIKNSLNKNVSSMPKIKNNTLKPNFSKKDIKSADEESILDNELIEKEIENLNDLENFKVSNSTSDDKNFRRTKTNKNIKNLKSSILSKKSRKKIQDNLNQNKNFETSKDESREFESKSKTDKKYVKTLKKNFKKSESEKEFVVSNYKTVEKSCSQSNLKDDSESQRNDESDNRSNFIIYERDYEKIKEYKGIRSSVKVIKNKKNQGAEEKIISKFMENKKENENYSISDIKSEFLDEIIKEEDGSNKGKIYGKEVKFLIPHN